MDDLENLLTKYEHYLKGRRHSPKTIVDYKRDIGQYIRFCSERLKDHPEIWRQGQSVMRYLSKLSRGKSEKTQKVLKPSSIARSRAALLELSNYHREMYGDPIFLKEEVKSPKIGHYLPNYYKLEDIQEIIECFHREDPWELRDLCLVLFLFGSGLRAQELLDIKPRQVFPFKGITTVIGKGNRVRSVFLPNSVWELFLNYQDVFRSSMQKEEALFFSKKGSPLTYSGLYYIITNIHRRHPALRQNKHLHPHGFRHSFATALLSGGADIRRIADLLGHSSLDTTQKYAHVDKEFLQNTMENFHPRFR